MFAGQSQFTLSTKIREGAPAQQTTVTVDWSGYTEDMAKADLIAGQSPRVAIQARLREDGIPKELTIKASEWRAKRVRTVAREMTPEEILEYAKKNPAFMEKLLASATEPTAE